MGDSGHCCCDCCNAKCPYIALVRLVSLLKNMGVTPDVSAECAIQFLLSQCNSEDPRIAEATASLKDHTLALEQAIAAAS